MSWHDAARGSESAEDRLLREELSQLLGLPTRRFFDVQPTEKMIALAEDLRREALRRKRTSRHRPVWMLMAAALPAALVLGGLGYWGTVQKHRADALAEAIRKQDSAAVKVTEPRLAESTRQPVAVDVNTPADVRPEPGMAQVPVVASDPVVRRQSTPAPALQAGKHPGELVIEVKPPAAFPPTQTQTVRGTLE